MCPRAALARDSWPGPSRRITVNPRDSRAILMMDTGLFTVAHVMLLNAQATWAHYVYEADGRCFVMVKRMEGGPAAVVMNREALNKAPPELSWETPGASAGLCAAFQSQRRRESSEQRHRLIRTEKIVGHDVAFHFLGNLLGVAGPSLLLNHFQGGLKELRGFRLKTLRPDNLMCFRSDTLLSRVGMCGRAV